MSLPVSLTIGKYKSFRKAFSIIFLVLFSGFTFLFNAEIKAQGNLLLTPRRIVFDGSKRSMDLNLANTGTDTATYAISIVQVKMTDEGGFETITQPEPGQQFAEPYIRFFPRSVTLGPNEVQIVKLQLVRATELKEGEYRSHIYFRSVQKAKPLGEKETAKDTNSISVVLTPVFGITIPVIIRLGESTAQVNLSDLNLSIVNDTIPNFKMTFNRSGNMSVYGDIAVDHISPQGKITRVGIANGVAVYTPNQLRKFQINLNNIPGVDYKSGKLHVTYSSSSDVKPVKYAEAELLLQ